MKIFLFSRRFLIPFFITGIGFAGYLYWDFWRLYRPDFQDKGLPGSFLFNWLLLSIMSSDIILISFLLGILAGSCYYAHYQMKKHHRWNGFSIKNIIIILLLALTGFLYTSFVQHSYTKKSRHLLFAIVMTRSWDEAKVYLKQPQDDELTITTEQMLSLRELYKAKHWLASGDKATTESEFHFINTPERMARKIDFEIAKKIRYPLLLILFYALGNLLGISLNKIHVVFSLLIAYFIVFTSFFYIERLLAHSYRLEKTGLFWGVHGITVVLALAAIIWYWLLKRKITRQQALSFEFEEPPV